MEMLEEQQREEMELAALQEEQEYEQVRQQQHIMPNWISESMPKLCYLDLRNSGKAVCFYVLCSVRINLLNTN